MSELVPLFFGWRSAVKHPVEADACHWRVLEKREHPDDEVGQLREGGRTRCHRSKPLWRDFEVEPPTNTQGGDVWVHDFDLCRAGCFFTDEVVLREPEGLENTGI
ncbi:MAG: hypothetical protein U0165_08195 [Polyangiaceae bacterium]